MREAVRREAKGQEERKGAGEADKDLRACRSKDKAMVVGSIVVCSVNMIRAHHSNRSGTRRAFRGQGHGVPGRCFE